MSVSDFLNAYDLELQRRQDLVIRLDFLSVLFSDYLFETILGISSIIAAVYLSVNNLMVLGIGQAVLIGLYITARIMQKESKSRRTWPPTRSVCPNGFFEVMDTGLNRSVCHKIGVENPIPGSSDVFVPDSNKQDKLCVQAQGEDLYWDQCQS